MKSATLAFVMLPMFFALASATCICVDRTSMYAVPLAPFKTITKIFNPLPHHLPHLPHLPSFSTPKIPSLIPHLPTGKPEIPEVKPENPSIPNDPYGQAIKPENTPTASAIHQHPILNGIVTNLCAKTDNASLCTSAIQPFLGMVKGALDSKAVLKLAMKAVVTLTVEAKATCEKFLADPKTDQQAKAALNDCKESYDDAVYSIQQAEASLDKGDKGAVGAMLSAVSTDADTCENGFDDFEIPSLMGDIDSKLMKLNGNCLAIAQAAGLMDAA